ncbi:hypothetical protein [Halomicronema hongdechloris]|nr:hypothetical protein [Halomicronema hongdechloris]
MMSYHPRRYSLLLGVTVLPWLLTGSSGCHRLAVGDTVTVEDYTATATVVYTWQVEYARENFDRERRIRRETFASNTLVNRNGLEPAAAVTGPDDQGLWWPALPPRPTVDDLEARQKPREKRTDPQLLKSVEYAFSFDYQGQLVDLPSNERVYRQAVKAYAQNQALELTLGPGNGSVAKATPVSSGS